MAKESGINYFYSNLRLDQSLDVFYTFEEGAGTSINSVLSGNSLYNGSIIGGVNSFWNKPGSGLFSGNRVTIGNASGLYNTNFTHIFAYDRIDNGDIKLFSNRDGQSGYTIGVTPTNKIYFECINNSQNSIVATSNNNLSSKNLIAISFLTNNVSINYYNFNAKLFETETFNYPFGNPRGDNWRLGESFTGYLDYYIYFNEYLSPSVLNSLASGFYNIPTGTGFLITTQCVNAITGYVSTPFTITGVTGYFTSGVNFDGNTDFNVFPEDSISIPITGIISSGVVQSGVSGILCQNITGAKTILFDLKTEYVSSFGMDKIQLKRYTDLKDLVKWELSKIPFDNSYNFSANPYFSGFDLGGIQYTTGGLNLFVNGVANGNSGTNIFSRYIFISGTDIKDIIIFDIKSGNKNDIDVPPYLFNYSGQSLFLNGVDLITGKDFNINGNLISLTNPISGTVSEYPIVLPFTTGSFSYALTGKFSRNTSRLYLNGIRQINKVDYIEGCRYDMLSGNQFNENNNIVIFNDDTFWE